VALCRLGALWLCLSQLGAAAPPTIQRIEPTPLFPTSAPNQPLRQRALLHLDNPGSPLAVTARITLGKVTCTEALGEVPSGRSTNAVTVPDIATPAKLTIELLPETGDGVLARHELTWQPQKKWKIYCVSYSHHDLGFGDYPHRLRTDIRHANIERPLKFCTETDGWDEDSKFRYVIETSEPITSFLGSHSEADAAELARRIREGRIQIGAMHNTASTEQMSYELMARLFYLTGRHTPDLLGVAPSKTAQIDDVIGLTWPLATYCAEAGVPYFFHGHNGVGQCLQPASAEPVFYWQGPDGQSKVLVRSIDYGGYAGDNLGDGSETPNPVAHHAPGRQLALRHAAVPGRHGLPTDHARQRREDSPLERPLRLSAPGLCHHDDVLRRDHAPSRSGQDQDFRQG
jgi:hypothetical protein